MSTHDLLAPLVFWFRNVFPLGTENTIKSQMCEARFRRCRTEFGAQVRA